MKFRQHLFIVFFLFKSSATDAQIFSINETNFVEVFNQYYYRNDQTLDFMLVRLYAPTGCNRHGKTIKQHASKVTPI
jgi:hypothetical protein